MAKIILTPEARQADRIIRCLPSYSQVGKRLGISRQLARYRINEIYPKDFAEFIKLLDLAGYEIKEKEET